MDSHRCLGESTLVLPCYKDVTDAGEQTPVPRFYFSHNAIPNSACGSRLNAWEQALEEVPLTHFRAEYFPNKYGRIEGGGPCNVLPPRHL